MKKTTTEYFYNDNEALNRVVTTETTDCIDCGNMDEGKLLTSEVEVVSEGTETLAVAALVLSAIGFGISIAKFLHDR